MRSMRLLGLLVLLFGKFISSFQNIWLGRTKLSVSEKLHPASRNVHSGFNPFIQMSVRTLAPGHRVSTSSVASTTISGPSAEKPDAQVPIAHFWPVYEELVSQLVMDKRTLRKISLEEAKAVQDFLLDPQLPQDIDGTLNAKDFQIEECIDLAHCSDESEVFRSRLQERKERFNESRNFTKSQVEYLDRCFSYMGDRCASTRNVAPLQVAWLKLREAGAEPKENCVSTYMYVLGLDEDKENSPCFWDTIVFHDLLFPPNEKTITLRIQLFISQNNPQAAEDLIDSILAPSKGGLGSSKLRTFAPILAHYCERHDMARALSLLEKMRQSEGVVMDSDSYALLLSALASQGYFHNSVRIEGQPHGGPDLFDHIATQMAEDLLEITEEAAKRIYSSIKDVVGIEPKSEGSPDIDACCEMAENSIVAGKSSINSTTCVCPHTGAKLRLLTLDDKQRQYVHDSLLDMSFALQEEFREKVKASPKADKKKSFEPPTGDYCREKLSNFSSSLAEKQASESPFTVFVDGANVAYFGQGKVQYSQVKLMIDTLEEMGEKPLVIMPKKYTYKKFFLRSMGIFQELTPKDQEVLSALIESEKLYVVSQYCFDDYYHMIATVAAKTLDKVIVCENRKETLPGLRPIVISNDQMRDHRLALMDPRPFRRWTSTHFVNYHIDAYDNDTWEPGRTVKLVPPITFSREIQVNEVPSIPGRKAWHFPITGWGDAERFCISFPYTITLAEV